MMEAAADIRPNIKLPSWQRALVFGWAALALIAMFTRGRQTDIDHQVTSRLRYHAIPVAMSVLYHGRVHDYTASWAPRWARRRPDRGPIEWGLATTDGNRRMHYWADDRHGWDYVGAFMLLAHADSLLQVLLRHPGLSVLLFLLDLGWHAGASATLIFALGALYTCLAVIPLGNLTVAMFEPGSLFEPRVIELLSFVAALHLGVTSFISSRWSPGRIAIVAGQAAILAACYHARSSVGWEVVFVLAAGAAFWMSQRRTARIRSTAGIPPGGWRRLDLPWPVVCLAAVFALLIGYERYAYNPRYFQDMGARTVWHNSLMGLGSNQHLAERYHLGISDAAVIDSVTEYLRSHNDPRLTSGWTQANILSSLGGHAVFNWFVYEQAARDLYRHLWRTEPRSMLHLYLIDKTSEIRHVVVKATQHDPEPARNMRGLYFQPLAVGALMIILPGLLIACAWRPPFTPLIAASLLLVVCSTIPGLLFYPVVHTMMGCLCRAADAVSRCRLDSRRVRHGMPGAASS